MRMKDKSLFICLASLLSITSIMAQDHMKTLDYAYLQAQYSMTYQLNTISQSIGREDLIYLDIGKDFSKCYSYYTFQSDSLLNTPTGKKEWRRLFEASIEKANGGAPINFPHRRNTFVVYKDLRRGVVTVQDFIGREGFEYQDSLHPTTWKVNGDSIRELHGYSLQEATTTWRGRQWSARFAPSLPLDNGPWKFGGLPGLIFEISDKKGHYRFTLIKLEMVASLPIIYDGHYGPYGRRLSFQKSERIPLLRGQRKCLETSDAEAISVLGASIGTSDVSYDLMERAY